MSVSIHPSAHVDSKAQLDAGVEIGPLCVVGPNVKLEKNVKLIGHVNLAGDTTIGADCRLYPFVSMGHPPQDFKHKGGPVSIKIGERNQFRENVNIHPGTDAGKPDTIIGDDCYFMVNSHLAHEGYVGNNVVVSNGAQIGGCVTIGDNAILGGLCAIHQFTRIGQHAFIGGMATVTTDVIPYGSVVGNPAHLAGLNVIGLKRRGFDRDTIHDLRAAYRLMFAQEGTFSERIQDATDIYNNNALAMDIVAFINGRDKRSICLPPNGR
ncbi:MAG: acyl-ACP--UDP-N-acetylglucosamine O-acyltransferase [Acidimicrobiales bacterium]|nr:acyl-ACP--UDP-N-acetylglucosamine O-acyltransferase [Hyphomonadaceae bacterium]RZV40653.1 MAG: acyl-ACP--UDP-N-acetylglucosamine O-acyltransferase [Acidimicrobiales bacterium]